MLHLGSSKNFEVPTVKMPNRSQRQKEPTDGREARFAEYDPTRN